MMDNIKETVSRHKQGKRTYQLTVIVTAHTARHNPSARLGGGHVILPLAEDLLACDSGRESKSQFL